MPESSSARFDELSHHVAPLSSGGFVLLLDSGAVISPEAEAMLQALYSRSPKSVHAHLKEIAQKGAEKFMSGFYVGYGHKSIGDCGSITLFIEGISMLAAKAIQDSMLYSGQEVSTRYVDFSTQMFIDPRERADAYLERLRDFYVRSMPHVVRHLTLRFPKQGDEQGYEKAINARAFDIMRGFLPAGAMTSVSWHTNLRQAADKLMLLRHHPLEEVRGIAETMQQVLSDGYPSSFGHKRYPETEGYNENWMKDCYYFTDSHCPEFAVHDDNVSFDVNFVDELLQQILVQRPPKTELPKFLAELGTIQFRFLLDFGSFRDIERHRAVSQRMPLLTTEHGFEPWYLDELPDEVRKEAEELLGLGTIDLDELVAFGCSKEELQYYIPMGYRVAQRITGDLPALVYLAELRATRFVHPTLQVRAQQIAAYLTDTFGEYGLKLYVDDEVGRFDARRGLQDITKKE